LATGQDNQTPHHWEQGPQKVHSVMPFTHDGFRCSWRWTWYLDRVEGTGRRVAGKAIRAVLANPLSWQRTGVAWVRTYDRVAADIEVSVIPEDNTACGKGAAGCFSWDGQTTPKAELGVEYIGDPNGFAELVNMEVCGHGTFAMADMYTGAGHDSANYVGVMGTWGGTAKSHYYPSDAEIADAKAWLAGQAPYIHPGE